MTFRLSGTQLVVLSAWGSRIASAGAMLYSLRLLSQQLGPSDYAVFIVVSSLVGWFALADLGTGYALQNAVTRHDADGTDAAGSVLSVYALVAAVAAVLTLVFYLSRGALSSWLFGRLAPAGDAHLTDVFFRSAALLSLTATAGLSTRILYGRHRGHVANLCTALAAVLGVALLVVGIEGASDQVTFAVSALYGPAVALGLVLGLVELVRALRRGARPRWADARALLRSSAGFFVFYLMAAAVLQVDYLVMSQKIEAVEIVQYYSLSKLFAFVLFFNHAILFATWPTMTRLHQTGQWQVIRRLIGRLLTGSVLLTSVATALIYAFRAPLKDVIAPGLAQEFRPGVIAGFGALALLRCLTDPFAILLQSAGRLRALILIALVQAILGAILQWNLSSAWGIEGVLVALLIAYLATAAWGVPMAGLRLCRTTPASPPDLPQDSK